MLQLKDVIIEANVIHFYLLIYLMSEIWWKLQLSFVLVEWCQIEVGDNCFLFNIESLCFYWYKHFPRLFKLIQPIIFFITKCSIINDLLFRTFQTIACFESLRWAFNLECNLLSDLILFLYDLICLVSSPYAICPSIPFFQGHLLFVVHYFFKLLTK